MEIFEKLGLVFCSHVPKFHAACLAELELIIWLANGFSAFTESPWTSQSFPGTIGRTATAPASRSQARFWRFGNPSEKSTSSPATPQATAQVVILQSAARIPKARPAASQRQFLFRYPEKMQATMESDRNNPIVSMRNDRPQYRCSGIERKMASVRKRRGGVLYTYNPKEFPQRPETSEEKGDGDEFAALVESHAGQFMPAGNDPLVEGNLKRNPPRLAEDGCRVVEEDAGISHHVIGGDGCLRLSERMEVEQWLVPFPRESPGGTQDGQSRENRAGIGEVFGGCGLRFFNRWLASATHISPITRNCWLASFTGRGRAGGSRAGGCGGKPENPCRA